jgi:hypothetical protein
LRVVLLWARLVAKGSATDELLVGDPVGLVDVTSRCQLRAAELSMAVMPERRMSACLPSGYESFAGRGGQQLASKGVQDGHLSISPETSFFKRTYKRVSNLAIEAIDQTIPSLAWGKELVVQAPRNGDLLSDCGLSSRLRLCA